MTFHVNIRTAASLNSQLRVPKASFKNVQYSVITDHRIRGIAQLGARITGIHRRKFPIGILQLKEQKCYHQIPQTTERGYT